MRSILSFAVTALVLIFSATAGLTQEASSPEKIADIKMLMEITGSDGMGEQVMDQMVAGFSRSRPDIPAEFWTSIRAEVDPNGLVESILPIYDKYLSHQDVKDLIEFYQSPIGKKFLEVLPNIGEESYYAGQEWGNMVAQKVLAKLQAEGYDTPQAPGQP